MNAVTTGNEDPVARFAESAMRYCAWAETAPPTANGEVETAIRLLLELTARVLDLPDATPGDEDFDRATHEQWDVVFRRFETLPVGYYGTCDPAEIVDGSLLVGDLRDDLADIWRDLREGLDAYAAGERDTASWRWSFTFGSHWGTHASEALRVLVAIRNGQMNSNGESDPAT